MIGARPPSPPAVISSRSGPAGYPDVMDRRSPLAQLAVFVLALIVLNVVLVGKRFLFPILGNLLPEPPAELAFFAAE